MTQEKFKFLRENLEEEFSEDAMAEIIEDLDPETFDRLTDKARAYGVGLETYLQVIFSSEDEDEEGLN